MPRLQGFDMRAQILREWCWAGVSGSIEHHYDPATDLTECKIAAAELHLSCCDSRQQCNRVHRLDPPLERLGRLRAKPIFRPISFDEVRQEIDAGRPIAVRVGWHDGGGHFLVIFGYHVTQSGLRQVILGDPFYGDSRTSYDLFCTSYQGSGTWTDTFLLKDPQ